VRIIGRDRERAQIGALLDAVREGASRSLVISGEPGIGKTVLLADGVAQGADFRIVRVSGVESEMELAFSALHQVCQPLLGALASLPEPQADALRTTFGVVRGPVPDRFLVGLGVLALFAESSADRPLLCVVDDAQWVDRASLQILAFAARRLGAESIAMLFGSRRASGELTHLPELALAGLSPEESETLIETVLVTGLEPRVRAQLVAEIEGNPLALVEIPKDLSDPRAAGGYGLPGAVKLPSSVEEMFARRIRALPERSRQLLLIAAADPTGDPVLMWRAAERVGIPATAAAPAIESGLVEFGLRVRFRHPLARSAAYQAASPAERRRVHAALAHAVDASIDPEPHAWHRAQAAAGPDEDVAAELERASCRAQARGGLTAAGAFLRRAVVLSPAAGDRVVRALKGAQIEVHAGEYDAAAELLAVVDTGPADEIDHARADIVRAQLAFAALRGREAPALFLAAARRIEPLDAATARTTYLDALWSAMFAGRLSVPGADIVSVSAAAVDVASGAGPDVADRLRGELLDDFAGQFARGLPRLRDVLVARTLDLSADEEMQFTPLAATAASGVWDHRTWTILADRFEDLCREGGSLANLPLALTSQAFRLLFAGELRRASVVVDEVETATTATGSNLAPYAALAMAAFRGDESRVAELAGVTVAKAARLGEGWSITAAEWATAIVKNATGKYREAVVAAERASSYGCDLGMRNWALAELVEAAARSGDENRARRANRALAGLTSVSDTAWARGTQARSDALVSDDADAECLYRTSIELLGAAGVRAELARARLVYGEWLRRARRRSDARVELQGAFQMFEDMGMKAFAERAHRELWATGGAARLDRPASGPALTAQELQVARLAREGLTNPEIGTRLFISARTVEYHLGKVFTKLGISSRAQLAGVDPGAL
jgi:DNA-binding CsgD family transcriptional regulator